MINPSIRVLTRRVVSGQRRCVSDWNSMAELFMEPPAKAKPIRRNNSSTASGSTTTPPLPEPALQTLPLPTKTSTGPVPLSKAFPTSLLNDLPAASESTTTNNNHINWSDSFHGLGSVSFEPRIQEILLEPIDSEDIEITPDGLLYLPEIKYRRVLNRAFGAGGWGLAPRSETMIQKNGLTGTLTREYLLICQGRLIAIARGEQDFFNDKGIPTLSEGCKSNALMRCCKDLGIASELWDPKFIRKFKKQNCEEVFVEHVVNKRKKKIWKRKDGFVEYPFKKT